MTGDPGNDTLRRNERFLTQIFGPVFKYVHVAGVGGDPSKKESGPWGGGYAQRMLRSIGPGTNNYFCVSLFTSEVRRINTFDRLVCLTVDDTRACLRVWGKAMRVTKQPAATRRLASPCQFLMLRHHTLSPML